jgi:O-antigen/teichoic acid export membrane protein
VSVNLILLSMILYLRTNIAATGHYRLDSIISVLDKLILIILLSLLLFHPKFSEDFNLFSFIYAQTLAFSLVLIIVIIANFRIAKVFALKFDLPFSRDLLKKSLPFSLVIILMSLYMRMDGFMLESMLDDNAYQAGIYAAAFRIYEAINMVGYLFAVLLLPMFASLLSKKNELLPLIKSSHNLILAISSSAVVAIFLFKNEIMFWLYPQNADLQYGELLGLLLLSFFAISLSYIYGTYLTASNQLKVLNQLLFIGVLINFSLNIFLIPKWGAQGAAYATIVTQFFVLAGQYLLTIKHLSTKPDNGVLLKRLLYGASLIVIGWLYTGYIDITSWMIRFILLVIVFIITSWLFGMIQLKDFKKEAY